MYNGGSFERPEETIVISCNHESFSIVCINVRRNRYCYMVVRRI